MTGRHHWVIIRARVHDMCLRPSGWRWPLIAAQPPFFCVCSMMQACLALVLPRGGGRQGGDGKVVAMLRPSSGLYVQATSFDHWETAPRGFNPTKPKPKPTDSLS
ncbi:hypothetical protein CLAIMM_10761, partial [Cladophialophora immunda]